MKTAIVIPARYHSTRLPGKMLLAETGKFLVQHVYDQAVKSKLTDTVIIATDDERIASAAASFGVDAVLTSPDLLTGTERVAEAAADAGCEIVVNLQGDEPGIDPGLIDRLIELQQKEPDTQVATAAYRINPPDLSLNPNIVKVVINKTGHALYFSRSPIPYYRNGVEERIYYGHVGIYAYKRDFLLELNGMRETALEAAEKLEQLRVLENGHKIRVIMCDHGFTGIDTKEDYEQFVEEWKRKHHS